MQHLKEDTGSYLRSAGWDKIESVEIEQWFDEDGRQEFGRVIIIAEEGVTFAVDTRTGETEEGNATHYRKRGWTDDRCCQL